MNGLRLRLRIDGTPVVVTLWDRGPLRPLAAPRTTRVDRVPAAALTQGLRAVHILRGAS